MAIVSLYPVIATQYIKIWNDGIMAWWDDGLIVTTGWKWLEGLEMAANGWKQLDRLVVGEMAGIGWNGWKLLLMDVNG